MTQIDFMNEWCRKEVIRIAHKRNSNMRGTLYGLPYPCEFELHIFDDHFQVILNKKISLFKSLFIFFFGKRVPVKGMLVCTYKGNSYLLGIKN